MNLKWQKRFMRLAYEISTWSKDPSTQVGAVAVDSDRQVLSCSYNGFPSRIEDTKERLEHRETKYKYTIHAELSVILNAAKKGVSLNGAWLFVTSLPVCKECAKHIIAAGFDHVVVDSTKLNDERWKDHWPISKEMLEEAGIEIIEL